MCFWPNNKLHVLLKNKIVRIFLEISAKSLFIHMKKNITYLCYIFEFKKKLISIIKNHVDLLEKSRKNFQNNKIVFRKVHARDDDHLS